MNDEGCCSHCGCLFSAEPLQLEAPTAAGVRGDLSEGGGGGQPDPGGGGEEKAQDLRGNDG